MQLHSVKTATGQRVLWAAVSRARTDNLMFRLDAGAYCNESRQWDSTMAKQSTLRRVDSLADVTQPTMFGKRAMLGTATKGIPVYSSSEMLMVKPEPAFFLSRRFELKVIRSLGIKSGWVLISRSGSIGYTLYVSEDRNDWIVDDHMIRIVPHEPMYGALLYTYLSSPVGQSALRSLAYGAVQLEIKGVQVAALQVPIPDREQLTQIAGKVAKASESRTVANKVLAQANSHLDKVTGLSPLKKNNGGHTLDPDRKVECFPILSASICSSTNELPEYRLDAHFYNPTAQLAVANIKKSRCEVKSLGDIARVLFTGGRFKRNYVESAHGVPFLSGKNIVQIRPTGLKYLSNLQETEIMDLALKRGWTLVSRSGTVGRTCFVWSNYENYIASEDLLRVIPNDSQIDPGYIYAFLSSEYGYEQILRYRHGSVIDHVADKQIDQVLVPYPSYKDQETIGNMVREAYEKRAEAIRLEDQAQAILMNELTKQEGGKRI